MRISDWSSDVCSSDLRPALGIADAKLMVGRKIAVLLDLRRGHRPRKLQVGQPPLLAKHPAIADDIMLEPIPFLVHALPRKLADRTSSVTGKSVAVLVDHGVSLSLKQQNKAQGH